MYGVLSEALFIVGFVRQPLPFSVATEVVKLAREYDPEGIRTLGVVTKCDDAANAEASDIAEKEGRLTRKD